MYLSQGQKTTIRFEAVGNDYIICTICTSTSTIVILKFNKTIVGVEVHIVHNN